LLTTEGGTPLFLFFKNELLIKFPAPFLMFVKSIFTFDLTMMDSFLNIIEGLITELISTLLGAAFTHYIHIKKT